MIMIMMIINFLAGVLGNKKPHLYSDTSENDYCLDILMETLGAFHGLKGAKRNGVGIIVMEISRRF